VIDRNENSGISTTQMNEFAKAPASPFKPGVELEHSMKSGAIMAQS
jgi:hypothetical protein